MDLFELKETSPSLIKRWEHLSDDCRVGWSTTSTSNSNNGEGVGDTLYLYLYIPSSGRVQMHSPPCWDAIQREEVCVEGGDLSTVSVGGAGCTCLLVGWEGGGVVVRELCTTSISSPIEEVLTKLLHTCSFSAEEEVLAMLRSASTSLDVHSLEVMVEQAELQGGGMLSPKIHRELMAASDRQGGGSHREHLLLLGVYEDLVEWKSSLMWEAGNTPPLSCSVDEEECRETAEALLWISIHPPPPLPPVMEETPLPPVIKETPLPPVMEETPSFSAFRSVFSLRNEEVRLDSQHLIGCFLTGPLVSSDVFLIPRYRSMCADLRLDGLHGLQQILMLFLQTLVVQDLGRVKDLLLTKPSKGSSFHRLR